ncbi:MAG: glucosamine-6-phosphate deaminase [Bacteroidales bacterium]|jgi:glucosamine-6-phosphate deaminase|nr:glucosamine-6-phosphate deaminase [Bacteroidales bacterium]
MIQSFQKDRLTVRIFPDRQELGVSVARDAVSVIHSLLEQKAELNMIFAAAPSQNEFLEALCSYKDIEWRCINAFHMDEYVGLPAGSPQSFGSYLKKHVFGNLPFRSVNYLDGNHPCANVECSRYAALLQQYPADIVCMGIGENGHIAFNDPHVARFDDPEWVKTVNLDRTCRMQQVNDGCFDAIEEVPTHALSLTIPALMRAAYIFCTVPGSTKAWAVYHTINDDVSESIPATCLRKHRQAILYADTDSASLLA